MFSGVKTYCFVMAAVLLSTIRMFGQDLSPKHFIYTDIVYDAESIPNVGFEHFFNQKGKLRSLRFNMAYQVHFSDSFGMAASHGDRVSIGVYQGPAFKVGYSIYKSTINKKHWHNYIYYGLGLKYLWYDNIFVNNGKHKSDGNYRIQSENCFALVPQIAIGSKHTKNWLCADFYIGLQLHIKDRMKTISYDQQNVSTVNPNVPYKSTQVLFEPGLLVGINLGLLKTIKALTPASSK